MTDVYRVETTETIIVDGDTTTVVSVGGGTAASGSGGGSGGAPVDAGYLVTTSNATLTGEVVVGTTPGGELGGTWASPTVDATHSGSSHASVQAAAEATAAAALTAHEAAADPHPGYTTAAELTAALAGYQPLDSDLTAIAALSTTSYGRAFLTLANQAALMALLSSASDTASGVVELATSAETITGTDTARAVTPAGAAAAYQPLDSDLTAIAALSTTSFGRALLALADAAALRTAAGVGTISTQSAASVSITGGSVTGITDLAVADGGTGASDAATARTNLGLAIGSDVQAYDSDLAAVAGLSTAGLVARTGSGTAAARTITATSGHITVTNGDGVSGNPALSLPNSGVTAATYGSSSLVPSITVDAQGRVTAASTNAIADSPTTMILARAYFK